MAENPKIPGRGLLRRVVKRIVDSKNHKQTLTLECGHVIVRSAGQQHTRAYCTECKEPPPKLRRGEHRPSPPMVGGTRDKGRGDGGND